LTKINSTNLITASIKFYKEDDTCSKYNSIRTTYIKNKSNFVITNLLNLKVYNPTNLKQLNTQLKILAQENITVTSIATLKSLGAYLFKYLESV